MTNNPISRKLLPILCVTTIACAAMAGHAIAQDAPAAGGGTSSNVVTVAPSKSYVMEGIILAALAGAAIFAVVRSSPRGL